jgi:hypothetical protein
MSMSMSMSISVSMSCACPRPRPCRHPVHIHVHVRAKSGLMSMPSPCSYPCPYPCPWPCPCSSCSCSSCPCPCPCPFCVQDLLTMSLKMNRKLERESPILAAKFKFRKTSPRTHFKSSRSLSCVLYHYLHCIHPLVNKFYFHPGSGGFSRNLFDVILSTDLSEGKNLITS